MEIGFSVAESQDKIDEINYKVQLLDEMLCKEKLKEVQDFIVKFEEKSKTLCWKIVVWATYFIG